MNPSTLGTARMDAAGAVKSATCCRNSDLNSKRQSGCHFRVEVGKWPLWSGSKRPAGPKTVSNGEAVDASFVPDSLVAIG